MMRSPFGPAGPVLLLVLTGAACSRPQPPAPPPPLVTVARPVQQDVVDYRVLIGHTESVEQIEIRARVEGFLEAMHYSPGDVVEKGALLFTIEKEQYESRLDRAKAAVAAGKAELDRAQADLERVEEAVKTNAVSVQEVGLRRAERDQAIANLDAANAEVRDAERLLSYTEIRSPIAGRVGREMVSVGNLVGAGERTLLTTVFSLQPLYVYFELPERFIVRYLRENDIGAAEAEKEPYPIAMALESDEGFPHEGFIEFVGNTVDPTTGTIQVRGTIPNEDLKAYSGLFARVRVADQTLEGALLVEERAIGTDLGGKYVLVVGDDAIVERRGVVLGPASGELRVVTGLNLEDVYIVDGLVRARPGLPVTTQTGEEAAARSGQSR